MLFKFEVQDTGIGIPKDRMHRLFQSFSQVDASTTRRFGGTGLGLAICKQLSELMGGQIGVESAEGRGSTFWFTARMTCKATSPVAKPAGFIAPAAAPRSDIRILLVEDQEINCIVASELLKEAGFAHDIVHDGKAAVDAVVRGNYQLVLMDCQMPGLDGMEATRRIRQHEREHAGRPRVPIIALTANTSGADRDECIASGMDGFCSKPFTTRQLYDAIAAVLGTIASSPAPVPATSDASCAEEPPFDLQTVLQRCSGKSALASLILDKFQAQTSEALAKIESQIAAGNADELARVSHAVKGTAGLLDAKPFQAAAARLEEMGRSHVLEQARNALDKLRAEFDKCVHHIQSVKPGLADARATAETPHGRADR